MGWIFSPREGSEGLFDGGQEKNGIGGNAVSVADEERCPALAWGAARPGVRIRLTFRG